MNHPPSVQIDDFGVWAVELDVGVEFHIDTGTWTVVVGHDGPGDGICPGWGYRLMDFLVAIRGTLAMRYRPILIYFDIKDGDSWADLDPLNKCNDYTQKYRLAIQTVEQVFPGNVVQLYEFVDEHNGRYPTVPEMAGKAIIYFPKREFLQDNPNAVCGANPPFKGTLRSTWYDSCTSKEAVENSIETGALHDDDALGCGPEGCRVLRVDQYQADWTFEYSAPPNPLIVDGSAQPPWNVLDSVGDDWDCNNGDVSRHQIVREQGTVRFPYRTLTKAVMRAEGKPFQGGNPVPNGSPDIRRTGYGWTILVKPGNYPEGLRIDIPLILKKYDGAVGTVEIGHG